jgi:hypothetical protein
VSGYVIHVNIVFLLCKEDEGAHRNLSENPLGVDKIESAVDRHCIRDLVIHGLHVSLFVSYQSSLILDSAQIADVSEKSS